MLGRILPAGLLFEHVVDSLADPLAVRKLGLHFPALNKYRRRSLHPEGISALLVFSQALLHEGSIHIAVKSLKIETEFSRISDESRSGIRLVLPLILALVKAIVHLLKSIL